MYRGWTETPTRQSNTIYHERVVFPLLDSDRPYLGNSLDRTLCPPLQPFRLYPGNFWHDVRQWRCGKPRPTAPTGEHGSLYGNRVLYGLPANTSGANARDTRSFLSDPLLGGRPRTRAVATAKNIRVAITGKLRFSVVTLRAIPEEVKVLTMWVSQLRLL